jgi:hypothetical protein
MKKIMTFLLVLIVIIVAQVPIELQTIEVVTPTTDKHIWIYSANMDSTQRGNIGKMFVENGIADSTAIADSITALLARGYVTFSGDVKITGDLTFSNNRYISAIHGDTLAVTSPVWKTEADLYVQKNVTAIGTVTAYGDIYTDDDTNNTFLGDGAGNATSTATNNTFIGYRAGYLTAGGSGNTYIGQFVGQTNASGTYDVAVGRTALYRKASGGSNTVMGYAAGQGSSALSNFSNNCLFGFNAGYDLRSAAANNIMIGYKAGDLAATTGKFNILIGNEIDLATTATDSSVNIGNHYRADMRVRTREAIIDNTVISGLQGSMYVSVIDTICYIATKYNTSYDLVYKFTGCGNNDLFTFAEVGLKANTSNYINTDVGRTTTTVIQSQASTDAFPGPVTVWGGAYLIGGNHEIGGAKSARRNSYEIYADGIKLGHIDKMYCSQVEIRTHNTLYSPTDLSKPLIQEYPSFRVKNRTIEVANTLKMDSTATISSYYGMQTCNAAWQDSIYFAHSDSSYFAEYGRGTIIYSGKMNLYPNVEKAVIKSDDKAIVMTNWLDNNYGLPASLSTYISSLSSYDKIYLKASPQKTYWNLIRGYSATAGEHMSYRGSYTFEDQSADADAVLSNSLTYIDGKPVYSVDVNSTQTVKVPYEMAGKKVNAFAKDSGITNITTLNPFYQTITATGNGNIYLQENTSQGDLNVDGDFSYQLRHLDLFFADSARAIPITQNVYAHITNSKGDLFTKEEVRYITTAGDSITIQDAGDYILHYSFDGDADTANEVYVFKLFKNGTVLEKGATRAKSAANNAIIGVTGFVYLNALVAGDYLEMRVTNITGDAVLTVYDGAIYLEKTHSP